MNFKVDDAVTLLNIQYGVCFGVLFAHQFVDPTIATQLTFNWPSTFSLRASVLSLTIYFFLDWTTVNTLRARQDLCQDGDVSLLRVVFLSLWIWFLGIVVTLGRTSGDDRLLFLAVYALAASSYHIANYLFGWYPVAQGRQLFGTLAGLGVAFLSLVLLLRWFLQVGTTNATENAQLFLSTILVLVLVKVFHISILASRKTA
ncbi:MAG: hypothetical protein WC326_01965 [Candidatus Delongbacteria bacterium]